MTPEGCLPSAGRQPGGKAALRKSSVRFQLLWGIIPDSISSQMRKGGSLAVIAMHKLHRDSWGCRLLPEVFNECFGLFPSQVDRGN